MKDQSAPMLDAGLSGLFTDLDQRGLLERNPRRMYLVNLVVVHRRASALLVTVTVPMVETTGHTATLASLSGAGIKRGYVHGKSDKTASGPIEDPVHPTELLASIYHSFGIDPETIVYNHLNRPRELVGSCCH